MKEKFVVEYDYEFTNENGSYKIHYDAIWVADSQVEAVTSFWKSFDEVDRKRVYDLKIYRLDEIICDTSNPFK